MREKGADNALLEEGEIADKELSSEQHDIVKRIRKLKRVASKLEKEQNKTHSEGEAGAAIDEPNQDHDMLQAVERAEREKFAQHLEL